MHGFSLLLLLLDIIQDFIFIFSTGCGQNEGFSYNITGLRSEGEEADADEELRIAVSQVTRVTRVRITRTR